MEKVKIVTKIKNMFKKEKIEEKENEDMGKKSKYGKNNKNTKRQKVDDSFSTLKNGDETAQEDLNHHNISQDTNINSSNIKDSSEITNELKPDKETNEIKAILTRIEERDLLKQGQNIDDIIINTERIINSTDNITSLERKISKLESELLGNFRSNHEGSFWNTLKNSISKINFSEILSKISQSERELTEKVKKSKNELKTSIISVSSSISSSKTALSREITDLKSELMALKQDMPKDYLKNDDFKFELSNKFKELEDLKEVGEELQTLPTKLQNIEGKLTNLDAKLDNISVSSSTQIATEVPKEERSILELAQYMRDGLAQFENISRLYVTKKDKIEELGKLKIEHSKKIEETKKTSVSEGKEKGRITVAKEIAEKFPTEFNLIRSMFGDITTEKFSNDEILEITNDNKNELMPFVKGEVNLGKFKVLKQALLIDEEIIFKAEIEAVVELKIEELENNKSEEIIEMHDDTQEKEPATINKDNGAPSESSNQKELEVENLKSVTKEQ